MNMSKGRKPGMPPKSMGQKTQNKKTRKIKNPL